MIESVKPPPDVDELARRLSRRSVNPERSLAMRRALLDAADAPRPWRSCRPARSWLIGVAAVVAVAGAVIDFREGLQALMAGDARKAVVSLDRACATPSSSQMDICYWAAVAWSRTGDRVRARASFANVVARWPGSTHIGEANVALGWLLLDTGDRTAARARFAAAADDRMPRVRAEALRGLAAAQ